ncbi:MarR family winged helix-turn-helix transcriptional regulator [Robertkochia flava]|uniref:MarR family winged helix-turn-helix transcriptional regulator n=1 Tax=Robertkochia flava TaxID=3447986 RepID=UPI001CC94907|nr:MarR family transcriptional regulator [Robertkochia marina]
MTMPLKTVFYNIERAIKEYRKFSQRNLNKVQKEITVDQALILNVLNDQPERSQKELADLLYKDNAAMTRMVEGMVRKGLLTKDEDPSDRRKARLTVTSKGDAVLKSITPVILNNREVALKGITDEEIGLLVQLLQKIVRNIIQP